MYELEISELADRKFYKIANKNKSLFEAINKKIEEIKFMTSD